MKKILMKKILALAALAAALSLPALPASATTKPGLIPFGAYWHHPGDCPVHHQGEDVVCQLRFNCKAGDAKYGLPKTWTPSP